MRELIALGLIGVIGFFYFRKQPDEIVSSAGDTNVDIGRIGADITVVEQPIEPVKTYFPIGRAGTREGELASYIPPHGAGGYYTNWYRWVGSEQAWIYDHHVYNVR